MNTKYCHALSAVVIGLQLSCTVAYGQSYATARYAQTDGALYVYSANVGGIGLQTEGLFDFSLGTPMLGPTKPASAFDEFVIAFFSGSGLPSGLFNIGRFLPTGLSPLDIVFSYVPFGAPDVTDTVESFPAAPAGSAMYNVVTGSLILNVGPSAQALLLESSSLFNTGASPTLGALAPSQFDTKNLMFFNNDAPLPAGTFNLGAILPPGLSASQISLATKGNGIAVGIPVTVVPEPAAATLALATAVAGGAWFSARRGQGC